MSMAVNVKVNAVVWALVKLSAANPNSKPFFGRGRRCGIGVPFHVVFRYNIANEIGSPRKEDIA
jgi:hypothetical protein